MITTTISEDFVYLCMLHNEYLALMDKSENYMYRPISITKDKETNFYMLEAELISNQQTEYNGPKTDF